MLWEICENMYLCFFSYSDFSYCSYSYSISINFPYFWSPYATHSIVSFCPPLSPFLSYAFFSLLFQNLFPLSKCPFANISIIEHISHCIVAGIFQDIRIHCEFYYTFYSIIKYFIAFSHFICGVFLLSLSVCLCVCLFFRSASQDIFYKFIWIFCHLFIIILFT